MSNRLQNVSIALHIVAIYWLGIMSGFFGTYSANVSLAMQTFDGPLYATVQSALNRHVRHALFFAFFFLPPLWIGGALLAGWRARVAWGWWLAVSGLLYLLGIILFTREVNLPLNAYTESWDPANLPADWTQTRDNWRFANGFRSMVSSSSFFLGIVALALRR